MRTTLPAASDETEAHRDRHPNEEMLRERRVDVVATLETVECGEWMGREGDDEVEVSLVGSYNADAMRMELYLRVRAWEAGRRAAGW